MAEEKKQETSKEAHLQIKKASKELFGDIDTVDQLMAEEAKRNADLKRRILWLIPFNFGVIWGTLRYCSNVNNIAKRFWPNK